MKIHHKDNFFYAFSYAAAHGSPEIYIANIIKGLAYIPLAGAAAQLALVIASTFPCTKNPDNWAMTGALAGRAAISFACPFILPFIDAIVSIWRAVELKKQQK